MDDCVSKFEKRSCMVLSIRGFFKVQTPLQQRWIIMGLFYMFSIFQCFYMNLAFKLLHISSREFLKVIFSSLKDIDLQGTICQLKPRAELSTTRQTEIIAQ